MRGSFFLKRPESVLLNPTEAPPHLSLSNPRTFILFPRTWEEKLLPSAHLGQSFYSLAPFGEILFHWLESTGLRVGPRYQCWRCQGTDEERETQCVHTFVCSVVTCGMPVKQHWGGTYSTNCGVRVGGERQPVDIHLKNQERQTISSYSKVAEKGKSL